jgi:hypothetical protein
MGMLIVVSRGGVAFFYEGLSEGSRTGAKFGKMMKRGKYREGDTCRGCRMWGECRGDDESTWSDATIWGITVNVD